MPPRESPPNSPRQIALQVAQMEEEGWPGGAQETLNEAAQNGGLQPRDKALAYEILQGTLRRRILLDRLADTLPGFVEKKPSPQLRPLVRAAFYEYFFLSRIPPRATFHEAVQLARHNHGNRESSYVNALLRAMQRQYPQRSTENAPFQITPEIQASLPGWISRRLKKKLDPQAYSRFLEKVNTPLPLYGRFLPHQPAPPRPFLHRPDLAPFCMEWTNSPSGLFQSTPFQRGQYFVQDAAAQQAAALAARTLQEMQKHFTQPLQMADWCAAPGGKTAWLAENLRPEDQLTALDVSPDRLKRLQQNLRRLHLAHKVEIAHWTEEKGGSSPFPRHDPKTAGPYHLILIDAPCSGLATLRRHPEIRWKCKPADLERLQGLQLSILRQAAQALKPGGILLYGTCSPAQEENEAVIETFLEEAPFQALPPLADWPGLGHWSADGWLHIGLDNAESDGAQVIRLQKKPS